MESLRITGSWFSHLMVMLFGFLLTTALLTLLGIGNTLPAEIHKGAGIIFSIFFLLHLASTGHHFVSTKRKKYESDSTTYHIMYRHKRFLRN